MSNVSSNRIAVTLTQQKIDEVKGLLTQLNAALPFLTGLTTEERMTLPKINVANKAFVDDAIVAINANPALVPSYVNKDELGKDYTLYSQLDELVMLTNQFCEKLADTQMLAGSEAYVSALAAYRMFQAAADAGVPGADAVYDSLRSRFTGQGVAANPAVNGQ
jgi:hypothetical protein